MGGWWLRGCSCIRFSAGLPIRRAEVGRIDFAHDTAEVKIFFDPAAADSAAAAFQATTPIRADRVFDTTP